MRNSATGITLTMTLLVCVQSLSQAQVLPGYSSPLPAVPGSTYPPADQQLTWEQPEVRGAYPYQDSTDFRASTAMPQSVWDGSVPQTTVDRHEDWTSSPGVLQHSLQGTPSVGWEDAATLRTPVLQEPCFPSFCEHRTGVFGDYLYLRAREVDIPYATHLDGPLENSAPLSSPSVLRPEFASGFRAGGVYALNSWTSIVATYWSFESEASDSVVLPGNTGWLRSEVTAPGTASIATDSLFARVNTDIDCQMGDVAYSRLICGDCCYGACDYAVNLLVGVRYAQLDQRFHGEYAIMGAEAIDAEIDFEGLGPRLGLQSRGLIGRGFFIYGESAGTILMGKTTTEYTQTNATSGIEATAMFDDEFRAIPQLDVELGTGWQSARGNLRVRIGYYLGAWFNVATTPLWIDAVRRENLDDVDGSLIFDGLTVRADYRF